jgi:tRNA-binding protein
MSATYEDFQKLDIRTGVVLTVDDFPRANNPSYRVTVDFGELGIKQSSVQATNYSKEELAGMTVVAVVNFPPKNIAGFESEVLILGAQGADGNLALLSATKPAPPGNAVY